MRPQMLLDAMNEEVSSDLSRLQKQNLSLDFNYKPVSNLVINDKKHLTNQFIGKYLNFLDINKGTPVNSKMDLIELLVTDLKNYDKTLAYKLNVKKIHPKFCIKGQTSSNKNRVNSLNLIPENSTFLISNSVQNNEMQTPSS